jgi:hypothetical protein
VDLARHTAALLAGLVVGGGLAAVSNAPDLATDLSALRRNAALRGDGVSLPATLADLLPNAMHQGGAWSDGVVVGTVSSIEKEAGYAEPGLADAPREGVAGAHVTRFDNASAHWRTLRVTIAVEETLAGPPHPAVVLSWPVLGSSRHGEDADGIARALRTLGRIVVITRDNPSGPEWLGIRREVSDRQLGIAQVDDQGTLTLPFADATEYPGGSCCPVDGLAFMAGMDTLDELRTQAAAPAHTVTP